MYERIKRTTTPVIVDIGPGEGTYSILARHLRFDARWIGVEVFDPYIERFSLREKYDEIVVANVLDYQWPTEPFTVLMGDVIEHLSFWHAYNLLEMLKTKATEIMVSLPIVYSPQGCVHGNEFESHLYQWDFESMKEIMSPCESWQGEVLGRYWWQR